MSSTVETPTDSRPFTVDIPEKELTELRRRIAAARWPSKELVEDSSQGAQLATLQELAEPQAVTDVTLEAVADNVPQEAPGAFTDAILEVGGGLP